MKEVASDRFFWLFIAFMFLLVMVKLMWAIVGATTMLSPFTLIFARKVLDVETRQKR